MFGSTSTNAGEQRLHRRHRARTFGAAIAALAIVGLVTSACSSSGSSTKSSSSAAPSGGASSSAALVTPKTGGNVVMLMNGLSATIDPASNQLYSFTDGPLMAAIYGNLCYLDPKTGVVNYYLLKGMTSNADSTVWKMTLNPNIKFSDGTPLNAAAIMFNYARIADPASTSAYAPLAKTFQMQVLDDLDLQITLPAPNAYLPANIAEDLGAIGSPTAIQSEGKDFALHPVGAGPFKLQSLNSGQTIVVVRNPEFASFKPGQPYLDQITFQYLPDINQQQGALSNGQAQIVGSTGGGANDQMKATPGTVYYGNNTGGGQDLLMNTSTAPFNDVRARQAISLALDRTAAADAFAVGTPPATNFFSPNSPYYDKQYDYPSSDATKAQQLFDQLASEGKPVNFEYETISSPLQAPMANYLTAALAKFKNVKMTVKAIPAAAYTADVRAGRYQMAPHGLYMIPAVPDATDYFGTTGVLNTFHWNDPVSNAAIQEILKTPPSNTALLKKDWGIVQQQILAQDPVYFAGTGVLGLTWSNKLVNMTPINYDNYVIWGQVGYKA